MINTDFIQNIFEDMMTQIRANYDPDNLEKPYFMYGRVHEVSQLLQEKDKSVAWKAKKYPLIILYHSQDEQHGLNFVDNYQYSPVVSIVTDSSQKFRTAARYSNSIQPTVYVIYKLLLQEIADNPNFYQSYIEEIRHTIRIWDGNPSEDKKAGVTLDHYLDGINITFQDLRIFKPQPECPSAI